MFSDNTHELSALPPSARPTEITHYARLAEQWWDEQGPFWPLHRLNQLRVGYIRDTLCRHFVLDATVAQPLAGLNILDIGCGGGLLSEAVHALGARVHGVDVVARNIAIAEQHAQSTNAAPTLVYEATSAEALAANGRAYDAVLNMEVVEHVAEAGCFLGVCNRLVQPGGITVIATINRTALSWLFAIVGAEYILRWLPRGTHDWHRFPTPQEVSVQLEADGLDVIDRCGVRVNPFTRRFALTDWMAVNYMLVAVRPARDSPRDLSSVDASRLV